MITLPMKVAIATVVVLLALLTTAQAQYATGRRRNKNGFIDTARQTATPEQAMAMLARAVAAVQADKTKALSMFNTGEGGFLDGEHSLPSTLGPLSHRDADDLADASVALYLNTGVKR